MNYLELFDDVARDFGYEVAVGVVVATAINLSTPVLDEDWDTTGDYTNRVTAKIREQVDPKHVETVLDIWSVVHIWEIKRSLDLIEGAKAISFAELMKDRSK